MASSPGSTSHAFASILAENSTKKYFIEYGGFLSNHIGHGIIALKRLGASPQRAVEFVDWYTARLESRSEHEEEHVDIASEEDALKLLGANKNFYALVDYYEKRLKEDYGNSPEAMVADLFPKLSVGMAASALHGLIHLGYGFASQTGWMVCEGFAYLHFSYAPIALDAVKESPLFGAGEIPILEVIARVGQNDGLKRFLQEEDSAFKGRETSGFQRRFLALLGKRSAELMAAVCQIETPSPLRDQCLDAAGANEALKWLLDCCIIAYCVTTRPNYFFMLHGVTGCWSLRQILASVDVRYIPTIIRNYLCILLAAYLAEDCPTIDSAILTSGCTSTLEGMRQEVLRSPTKGGDDRDEHVFKLLQVCIETSKENTDPEMDSIYEIAADKVLNNPFYFRT